LNVAYAYKNGVRSKRAGVCNSVFIPKLHKLAKKRRAAVVR